MFPWQQLGLFHCNVLRSALKVLTKFHPLTHYWQNPTPYPYHTHIAPLPNKHRHKQLYLLTIWCYISLLLIGTSSYGNHILTASNCFYNLWTFVFITVELPLTGHLLGNGRWPINRGWLLNRGLSQISISLCRNFNLFT